MVTYEEAIVNVSEYIDLVDDFTAFDGSTALAIVFNFPKEKTLDDIIKFRSRGDE